MKHIWNNYSAVIPDYIQERIPVFAADGVKKSILFVGINPSYNASDDDILIKARDKKSLMYGSFYKRADAPAYFKTLEDFASELGYTYTQLNLLYIRENDRNLINTLDSDFIREQLELTYETIVLLKPVAIIFMSDWCRIMIDGPGRWCDSQKDGENNLTLNGTNIPVIFSDDIFIASPSEKAELARRLKMRLIP